MKHIEFHYHFLRQLMHENIVTLVYYRTSNHIVDIFTIALLEANFLKFHSLFGL